MQTEREARTKEEKNKCECRRRRRRRLVFFSALLCRCLFLTRSLTHAYLLFHSLTATNLADRLAEKGPARATQRQARPNVRCASGVFFLLFNAAVDGRLLSSSTSSSNSKLIFPLFLFPKPKPKTKQSHPAPNLPLRRRRGLPDRERRPRRRKRRWKSSQRPQASPRSSLSPN